MCRRSRCLCSVGHLDGTFVTRRFTIKIWIDGIQEARKLRRKQFFLFFFLLKISMNVSHNNPIVAFDVWNFVFVANREWETTVPTWNVSRCHNKHTRAPTHTPRKNADYAVNRAGNNNKWSRKCTEPTTTATRTPNHSNIRRVNGNINK